MELHNNGIISIEEHNPDDDLMSALLAKMSTGDD
jgi:hypothetical protein